MGDDGNKTKSPLELLAEQFRVHRDLLWHMALGMCFHSATDAKDLLQETAARMIAKVKEGSLDPAHPDFVTLARRHMANRRKAHWSRAEPKRLRLLWDATQSLDDRESPEGNPEQALLDKEDDELVDDMHAEIYERLPKTGHSRAVFDLTRAGISDEKTAAERLGLEVTQVNDARKTIRAKIKEVLEEHGLKMPELRKKMTVGAKS